jgi:hypothetical protein
MSGRVNDSFRAAKAGTTSKPKSAAKVAAAPSLGVHGEEAVNDREWRRATAPPLHRPRRARRPPHRPAGTAHECCVGA